MITIDGKTYRTLPEQVEENMKDIASIEDNIDVLETAIGGAIITTEQLEERIDALDNELIQGLADIDLQIVDVNARVDSVEDSLAQGLSEIYDPVSSATIIADKDPENKEVSFTLAADVAVKIDNSLQTPKSTLTDTILVGVDSTKAQCNVAVGDGLVIENDTLKATAGPRLDIVEDDVSDIKSKKWYEHNIIIVYRTANERVSSANSDGTFVATLTLINQDPIAYTFAHNQDYSLIGPRVMELQPAWQLLRLYRAVQLSNQRDLNLSRACSGALVTVDTASPYTAHYCINNSISTKYFDYTDTDWKRLLVVHGTQVGVGNVGSRAIEVSVGHPTFIGGVESSMWTTRDEFAAGEYNLTDSFGNSYSTYFNQQRIRCDDTVRELIGFGE